MFRAPNIPQTFFSLCVFGNIGRHPIEIFFCFVRVVSANFNVSSNECGVKQQKYNFFFERERE